jgi:hypothetical protein
MSYKRYLAVQVLSVALLATLPSHAFAQSAEPETMLPVRARSFSDFQPQGLQLGSINAAPSVTVTTRYDDNIYATESDTTADISAQVEPKLILQTGKERHFFAFKAEGKARRYASETREDTDDFGTSFGGYLDVIKSIKLPFNLSYETFHQDRQDNLSRRFTEKPVQVKTATAEGGIEYKPNRLGLKLIGRLIDRGFSNEMGLNSDELVVRNDADFTTNMLEAEASYDFKTDHTAYVRGTIGRSDYKRGIYDDVTNTYTDSERDNDNNSMLVGVRSDIKGIVFSDFNIGQEERNYDDPGIKDISNMIANAGIMWNVTKLTTLGFEASKKNVEDNEIIQGFDQMTYGASVDHELRRNVIVGANTGWVKREFDSGREDDLFRAGMGVDYKVAPQLYLGGEYIYNQQDSSAANNDFERNLFMLRLTGQY